LENAQSRQNTKIEIMKAHLKKIGDTNLTNELKCSKMLNDLATKVKEELKEHHGKREETEDQILSLIEKLCDKSTLEKETISE
jgi:tryptophanyl-tRNA synthetase